MPKRLGVGGIMVNLKEGDDGCLPIESHRGHLAPPFRERRE